MKVQTGHFELFVNGRTVFINLQFSRPMYFQGGAAKAKHAYASLENLCLHNINSFNSQVSTKFVKMINKHQL